MTHDMNVWIKLNAMQIQSLHNQNTNKNIKGKTNIMPQKKKAYELNLKQNMRTTTKQKTKKKLRREKNMWEWECELVMKKIACEKTMLWE